MTNASPLKIYHEEIRQHRDLDFIPSIYIYMYLQPFKSSVYGLNFTTPSFLQNTLVSLSKPAQAAYRYDTQAMKEPVYQVPIQQKFSMATPGGVCQLTVPPPRCMLSPVSSKAHIPSDFFPSNVKKFTLAGFGSYYLCLQAFQHR